MPTREELRLARKAMDQAIVERYAAGASVKALMPEFGCSKDRILLAIKREMDPELREAVKRRNKSKASSATQEALAEEREERNTEIVKMYLETDLNTQEIGDQFDMSGANVYAIVRYAGYRAKDRKINKD